MLKYADITQNTYVQSWTVMEIMALEQCGILAGLHVCDNIYSLHFLEENFWLKNDSCDVKQYRS
jgi:hypothetical protein